VNPKDATNLRESTPLSSGRAAVFLDRDGTIIEETNYLARSEQVRLVAGAAEAIARLNACKVPVVVVTNQAGVARGYFTEAQVNEVHAHLDHLLAAFGAKIDRYYVCPHHPEAGSPPYRQDCDCRKPRPGLLVRAARELGIDLSASCMIGDKLSDLAAGAWAGCQTLLVRTGYGGNVDLAAAGGDLRLLAVTESLSEAVERWLRQRDGDRPNRCQPG
jgi:D-glycero-D-manno-heptose 1,7-bisphosphate phosphatase